MGEGGPGQDAGAQAERGRSEAGERGLCVCVCKSATREGGTEREVGSA